MKTIHLLDDSLPVEIFFCKEDRDLVDNICLQISESCIEDEKVFKHDETHLFLTRQQALDLVAELQAAVKSSELEND